MSDHEDNQHDTLQEYQPPQQNQEEEQPGDNQQKEKLVNSIHSSGSETPDKKSVVSEDDEQEKDPEQHHEQPTHFEPMKTQDFTIPAVQPLKNDYEVNESHELLGSAPILHQQHDTTAEVIVGENGNEQQGRVDREQENEARQNDEEKENNTQPYYEIQPVNPHKEEDTEPYRDVSREEEQPDVERFKKDETNDYRETEEEPVGTLQQQPNVNQGEEHYEHQQAAHQQDEKGSEHEEAQVPQEAQQTAPQNRSETEEQPEPPRAVGREIQLEPQIIDSGYQPPTQTAHPTYNTTVEKAQTEPTEQSPQRVQKLPEQQYSSTPQPSFNAKEKAITPKKSKKHREQADSKDSSVCTCLLF